MNRASLFLTLALMTFPLINADASVHQIDATRRGSVRQYDYYAAPGANATYYARSGWQHRNFFVFDIRSYQNVWVKNARLNLNQGATQLGVSKTLKLSSFSESGSAQFDFHKIGSGLSYGETTWSGGAYFDEVTFSLNDYGAWAISNQMIAYHRYNHLPFFGVGGRLTAQSDAFAFLETNNREASLFIDVISNRGPTAVSENISAKLEDGATLNGSGSYDVDAGYGDGITYEWDIDNDGTYDWSTGTSSTLTLYKTQLTSYGVSAGDNTIGLRVTDSWGSTNTTTSNLYINPVPEPATIAVWSVLGLCGIGYGARRNIRRAA